MSDQNADATAEFTITRIFDAPRDLVWQAWTDPDEAARWCRTPRVSAALGSTSRSTPELAERTAT